MKRWLLSVALAAGVAGCAHAPPAAPVRSERAFSVETTSLEAFAAEPAARAAVLKHLPTIFEHPAYAMIKTMSLKALMPYSQGALSEEKLKALQADLDLLP